MTFKTKFLRANGFTLIELMIVVVIFAVVAAVGVPSLQRYVADNRMLAVAQSFQAGLQTARAEAIRRNANADFILTTETDFPNATPASNSPTGQNWVVRTQQRDTPGTFDLIDSRLVTEGVSQKVNVRGNRAVVTFTGLGTMPPGTPVATIDFSHAGYACTAAGGDFRCLSVQVGVGGQIQLCDPAVAATATGDSRRCLQ